jgi:hypothetical protein
MSDDEEYRRQAAECRRMAENARSPLDKDAWLRLADSWLQMLPKRPETQAELPGRPEPSDDDLKESH